MTCPDQYENIVIIVAVIGVVVGLMVGYIVWGGKK